MGAEAIAVGRAIGDPEIVFWSMQTLAVAAYVDGRSDEVIATGVESLALAKAMGWGFPRLSGTVCLVMGHSAEGGDQLILHAREGIAISEVLGETWERGSLYQFLAIGLLRRGDLPEALRAGRRSLEIRRDLNDFVGAALALETLGLVESATAAHDRAARILGIAEALWESIPAPILEPLRAGHERVELDARVALGDAAFEAAFSVRQDAAPRRGGRLRARHRTPCRACDAERRSSPDAGRWPVPPGEGGRDARGRRVDERPGRGEPLHLRADGREPPREHLQQARRR